MGIVRSQLKFIVILLLFTIILSSPITVTSSGETRLNIHKVPHNDLLNTTQIDLSNATLELELQNSTIQYGDQLKISYGILDNSSNYLHNVSYQLIMVQGRYDQFIGNFSEYNSTLITSGYTTNFRMDYELETISITRSFLPNNYTVYFVPDYEINGTQAMIWRNIEIVANDEASLIISFFDNLIGFRIQGPLPVQVNRSRLITVRIDNIGAGNAVDISTQLSLENGPLNYNGSTTPLDVPVLTAFSATSFSINIFPPAFGISELKISLTYKTTLGESKTADEFLTVHTLPAIIAKDFHPASSFVTNNSTRISLTIVNQESVPVIGNIVMSSLKFSFTPSASARDTFKPGETVLIFNALALENGTAAITINFILYDPIGNDEYTTTLRTESVVISDVPVRIEVEPQNLVLISALILYGILLIAILLLFLRKDFRRSVINRLSSGVMDPDLEFENNKVIVDGSNIAWEELSDGGKPKIENVTIAIETLEQYGFKDITVVADAALRYQIEDPHDLDQQVKRGTIKVLPAKVDGDSFILRLSRSSGALILTNDLFKEYRDEYRFIDQRRIPYSIINGTFYLHPLYESESDS